MPLNPWGLTKGLVERIRDVVRRELGGGEPTDEDMGRDRMLEGPMTDAPTLMYRIQHAARTKTLLWMKYNNTWRHVEPYSFRYRSRGMQPLFFGWCQLHDEIHSFRLDRVQDLHTTDRVFNPRTTVEIA